MIELNLIKDGWNVKCVVVDGKTWYKAADVAKLAEEYTCTYLMVRDNVNSKDKKTLGELCDDLDASVSCEDRLSIFINGNGFKTFLETLFNAVS